MRQLIVGHLNPSTRFTKEGVFIDISSLLHVSSLLTIQRDASPVHVISIGTQYEMEEEGEEYAKFAHHG